MKVFKRLLKNKIAIVLLCLVIILAGVTSFLAVNRSVVVAEQRAIIADQQAELSTLKEELSEKTSEITGLKAELALRETKELVFTPGLRVYNVVADISGYNVVVGRVQNVGNYYFETVKIIVVSYFHGGLIEDCQVATVKGLYPGEDAYWQTPRLAGVGIYREVYAVGDKKVEK